MAEYDGVGTPTALTVNKSLAEEEMDGTTIEMNGVKLSKGKFDGKFYADRKLTVSSSSPRVKGWKIIITRNGNNEEKEVEGNSYSFVMPSCTKMSVEAVLGEDTSVDSITDNNQTSSDIVTLTGIVVRKNATTTQGLRPGVYLWKNRKVVVK